jgi:bifunctional DNA-binding transcriptional regulator/antitoxin component of YhaV-PrlF toxin-antitoxin module
MEKSYGEVTVDYQGRLIFPAKLRRETNLYNAIFEVLADAETSIVTLVKKRDVIKQGVCLFCGTKHAIFKELNGKLICVACYDAVK